MVLQAATCVLGSLYEYLVLTDYLTRVDTTGRSILFFRGAALEESTFRKGRTAYGKWIRRCRNLICQACFVYACLINPFARLSLAYIDRNETNFVIFDQINSFMVKIFVLFVPILYSLSTMYEETKQRK